MKTSSHRVGSKYQELKTRLFAAEILMLLKEEHTYKELSKVLNLPVPVISRYVNGHVLPAMERAEGIIESFRRGHLTDLVMKKISFDEDGIFDDSLLLSNTNLLDKVGKVAVEDFSNFGVNKVLTVEVDGIPLAAQVAREFNSGLVVAKARKEMGIKEFVEAKRVYSSGTYSYLFIPKDSIRKGDNILIVDDAIRTGFTIEAMMNICREGGAKVIGVFSLIGFKAVLRRLRDQMTIPIKALIEL